MSFFVASVGVVMASDGRETPLRYYTKKLSAFKGGADEYLGSNASPQGFYLPGANAPEAGYAIKSPIVPLFPFSVKMDFDFVMGVEDASYSMYEIIRVDIDVQKSIWFTLDSKYDGRQFIGLPKDPTAAQLVVSMAKSLGIPTYQAGLKVAYATSGNGDRILDVSYQRTDPSGEEPSKDIAFVATIPAKYDLDGRPDDSVFPKTNKRQSHGMNHSAFKIMALIDIYKAVPFLKLPKIKITWKSEPIDFQSILGFKVKSPISQSILGLSEGDAPRELDVFKRDENSVIYQNLIKGPQGEILQRHRYKFDLRDGKEELRSIDYMDPYKELLIGQMNFNPALPDLRYALSPGEHVSRVSIGMDAKGVNPKNGRNLPVFYFGQVFCHNDGDGISKIVEVRSGDARKKVRKQFLKTPEWTYGRPLMASLRPLGENQVAVRAQVMSPAPLRTYGELYEAKRVSELDYVGEYTVKWIVRTHRLSRLVMRTGQALEHEDRARSTGGNRTSSVNLYLEGGLWGNGGSAKDQTEFKAMVTKLKGRHLYHLSTRSFPMTQDLGMFPLDGDHFKGEKAKLISRQRLEVQLEPGLPENRVIPFLLGYKFASGPNHKEIGVSFNGFGIGIESYSYDAHSGILTLELWAEKGFGPELTRPYAGPLKQNLVSYSGNVAFDIGVLVAPNGYRQERVKEERGRKLGLNVELPGKLRPRNNQVREAGVIDVDKEPLSLVQGLSFAFSEPHQEGRGPDALRSSRYIRSMGLVASPQNSPDKWDFWASNLGELSWPTYFY